MKILNWLIDTLYDLFEYLLMFVILVIVMLVIFWRLNILFGAEIDSNSPKKAIQDTLKNTKNVVTDIISDSDLTGKEVEINVPKASNEDSIATILFEYELITDKEEFKNELVKSFKDKELPYGTFTIEIGKTTKEIIKILKSK